METLELPYEIAVSPRAVQDHYQRMIEAGNSPRFAEMLALQQPPGTKGTDRAFMEGRLNQQWLDSMPKPMAQQMLREARAAGIDTTGKIYMGGLADLRAHRDPEAWVDSTGDIKRVAAKRNLTVEGAVTCNGEIRPPERPPLSERIIGEEMKHYKKKFPGKKPGELREMIVERHAHPSKRKKK